MKFIPMCPVLDSGYRADFAGASCCANAAATTASKRKSIGKAAASGRRVDGWISTLGWPGIPVGSGTMGSVTTARRGLGAAELDTPTEWVGVPPGMVAVIADQPSRQNCIKHSTDHNFAESPNLITRGSEVMKFAITLTQVLLLCVAILAFCSDRASAQIFSPDNLEFTGGYAHISGDSGLNGFNLGTGLWFSHRVSLNFDYDAGYNNSTLGVLSLTNVGHTAVKSHLQDFMFGPRIFFPPHEIKKYKFDPFAEFKLGGAHLSEKLQQATSPTQSAADSAFAWALGGGADYQFTNQWFGRVNLDLLRTHFADAGQSRLRLVLGVGYTFSPRSTAK